MRIHDLSGEHPDAWRARHLGFFGLPREAPEDIGALRWTPQQIADFFRQRFRVCIDDELAGEILKRASARRGRCPCDLCVERRDEARWRPETVFLDFTEDVKRGIAAAAAAPVLPLVDPVGARLAEVLERLAEVAELGKQVRGIAEANAARLMDIKATTATTGAMTRRIERDICIPVPPVQPSLLRRACGWIWDRRRAVSIGTIAALLVWAGFLAGVVAVGGGGH